MESLGWDEALERAAEEEFECPKCGDGTALRDGEECVYCGLDNGPETVYS